MGDRAITRRTLLAAGAGAAAGAAAGALTRPAGVLAALAGPPPPRLDELHLGHVPAGALATVALPAGADLVGLQWQRPGRAHVQLRVAAPSGRWSGWVQAGPRGHDAEPGAATGASRAPRAAAAVVGEPIWTGGARRLQLRASSALDGVRVCIVDVSAGVGARRAALASLPLAGAAALALAGPPLASAVAQPAIIARRAWARGIARPRVAPQYVAVQMAFVHHTENPNGYLAAEVPAMLRAIYAFHRFVNGWDDIGYNFVVDAYGRIFEARAGGVQEPVVGAHAGGYNRVSTGVAVLGSFMSTAISPAARSALQALLAWKLSLHGVPARGRVRVRVNPAGARYSRFPANARVSLPRIAGHRDGDATDCPGDVLYGELPAVRTSVAALAPRPALLTLAASGPAPAGSAASAPVPATAVGGRLAFLDGSPIAGASVLVQARTVSARGETVIEQTVAEAATDATGAWSVPLSGALPVQGAALRALYPGTAAGGATVSEPVHVVPAASTTPTTPTTPAAPPAEPGTTPPGSPASAPGATTAAPA